MEYSKSTRFMAALAGMGLMSAFIVAGFAVYFAHEAQSYKKEVTVLQAERHSLQQSLNNIEDTLRSIAAYRDGIDELTTATIDREAASSAGRAATDRLQSIRTMLDRFRNYKDEEQAVDNLVFRADRIESQIQRTEQTMRGAFTILNHGREFLSAIPSISPAEGWLSSYFGERMSPFSGEEVLHRGIDIGAEEGTEVFATASGVVDFAGYSDSFGKLVVIKHPFGIMTKFAHNSELLIKKGDAVKRGQVIAKVGTTGRSTGPHVHYEVWVNDEAVDPSSYLMDREFNEVSFAADIARRLSIGGEEIAVNEVFQKKSEQSAILNGVVQQVAHEDSKRAVTEIFSLQLWRQSLAILILASALALLGYTWISWVRPSVVDEPSVKV